MPEVVTEARVREIVAKLIDIHASTLGGILESIQEALPEGHLQAGELNDLIEGGLPEERAQLEQLIRSLGGEPDYELVERRWNRGREVMDQLRAEGGA